MQEGTEEQRTQIIKHLEVLNKNVVHQMSPLYVFRNSIIYGFGFVIGSTLISAALATVVISFFPDTVFGDVLRWIVQTIA